MKDHEAGQGAPDASSSARASTADQPTHSPDGVDLSLIRWMLSLTPEERLAVLQSSVDSLLRLRREEAEG